jgi:hypothetical protein
MSPALLDRPRPSALLALGAAALMSLAIPAAAEPIRPAAFGSPAPGVSSPLFLLAGDPSPDLSRKVRDFVQANGRVSQFGYLIHFASPLCLRVAGLTPEQNEAVMSRMQAVAQTLSERIYHARRQSCPIKNVSVVFTPDPQHTLDGMIARNSRMVGDAHSTSHGVKTATRPIQAWFQTACVNTACSPDPIAIPAITATVLVDARRIHSVKLGAIADYIAMLVLADPRTIDHCQSLQSVLELFAGACPGRHTPAGLTPNDMAYLRALYTAGHRISQADWNRGGGAGTVDQVVGRMGKLLSGSGHLPSPGAEPELR